MLPPGSRWNDKADMPCAATLATPGIHTVERSKGFVITILEWELFFPLDGSVQLSR